MAPNDTKKPQTNNSNDNDSTQFNEKKKRLISYEEISRHKSDKSCWVVFDQKVFDVTTFLDRHPGGKDMILNFAGDNLTYLMMSSEFHQHSKYAYRLLADHFIGYVEDYDEAAEVSDSDNDEDGDELQNNHVEKKRTFVNSPHAFNLLEQMVQYDEPIFSEVHTLKKDYWHWVHTPTNKNLRLFKSNFVENCSKCPWYVVPLIWGNLVAFCLANSYNIFRKQPDVDFYGFYTVEAGPIWLPIVFLCGVILWTFAEYLVHRHLFHMKPPVNSPFLITMHFLLHGMHHKAPFDPYRLVFPPVPASVFAVFFYTIFSYTLPDQLVHAVFGGFVAGYILYDLTHYFLHHSPSNFSNWWRERKTYHVRHHFVDQQRVLSFSALLKSKVKFSSSNQILTSSRDDVTVDAANDVIVATVATSPVDDVDVDSSDFDDA